jgi:hypothetical protein
MVPSISFKQSLEIQKENALSVSVLFRKNLSRQELIQAIAQVQKPQVIFWYIGEYGLREQGVNYYKKDLKKILETDNQSTCVLYDLTAWAALKDKTKSLYDSNSNMERISQFGISGLKTLKSNDFFEWLEKENNPKTVSYFQDVVLKRPFIFKASQGFPNTNIKIGEVFKKGCPILTPHFERDCGKSYSALQYLEGYYLISQLVEEGISQGLSEINLIFALPNDEWKYYEDKDNSLMQDVSSLTKEKLCEKTKNLKVNILFYTFNFTQDSRSRPYNAGSKNIDTIQKSQIV